MPDQDENSEQLPNASSSPDSSSSDAPPSESPQNAAQASRDQQQPAEALESQREVPALLRYFDFDYGSFVYRKNVRAIVTLVILALLVFLCWTLSSVLIPFATGIVIAYILEPLVRRLTKKGVKRKWAVSFVYTGALAFVTAFMISLVPLIAYQTAELEEQFETLPQDIGKSVRSVVGWSNNYLGTSIDPSLVPFGNIAKEAIERPTSDHSDSDALHDPPDALISREERASASASIASADQQAAAPAPEVVQELPPTVKSSLLTLEQAERVASMLWDIALAAFGTLVSLLLFLILTPIYTFYLMLAWNTMWRGAREYLPANRREKIVDVISEINAMIAAFLRGRLLMCIVVAIIATPLFMAFDTPLPAIFGALTGIAAFIPYFPVPGVLAPCLLLMLAAGGYDWVDYTLLSVLFLALVSIQEYVFAPLILGDVVELHPMAVLLAIFIFAKLFGFFGVLIAIPAASAINILARETVLPFLKKLAESSKHDPPKGAPA